MSKLACMGKGFANFPWLWGPDPTQDFPQAELPILFLLYIMSALVILHVFLEYRHTPVSLKPDPDWLALQILLYFSQLRHSNSSYIRKSVLSCLDHKYVRSIYFFLCYYFFVCVKRGSGKWCHSTLVEAGVREHIKGRFLSFRHESLRNRTQVLGIGHKRSDLLNISLEQQF